MKKKHKLIEGAIAGGILVGALEIIGWTCLGFMNEKLMIITAITLTVSIIIRIVSECIWKYEDGDEMSVQHLKESKAKAFDVMVYVATISGLIFMFMPDDLKAGFRWHALCYVFLGCMALLMGIFFFVSEREIKDDRSE